MTHSPPGLTSTRLSRLKLKFRSLSCMRLMLPTAGRPIADLHQDRCSGDVFEPYGRPPSQRNGRLPVGAHGYIPAFYSVTRRTTLDWHS